MTSVDNFVIVTPLFLEYDAKIVEPTLPPLGVALAGMPHVRETLDFSVLSRVDGLVHTYSMSAKLTGIRRREPTKAEAEFERVTRVALEALQNDPESQLVKGR